MMNNVEALNPTESNKKPLAEGPTKAPKANVDVQRPEMSPYVSILSGKPCFLFIYVRK